jgi:hypothetical protein
VTPKEESEPVRSDGSAWFTPVHKTAPTVSDPYLPSDGQNCSSSTTSVSESGSTIAESERFDEYDWAQIKKNILRSADSSPDVARRVDDIIANMKEHAVGRKLYYPPKYVEIEGIENELIPMLAHDINSQIFICETCQRLECEGLYCRKHSFALMCFGMEQAYDLSDA